MTFNQPPSSNDPLWQQWGHAARQPAIHHALTSLYQQLDEQVAARGPTCWLSGKCCKFQEYQHHLYVTGLEIAWFLQQPQLASAEASHLGRQNDSAGTCPHQVNNLCSAHAIRPLGCRIFFCQQEAQHWQHPLYEQFLEQLRALHDQHHLTYRYLEWLGALANAGPALARTGRPTGDR